MTTSTWPDLYYSPSLNVFFDRGSPVARPDDLVLVPGEYLDDLFRRINSTVHATFGAGEDGWPILVIVEPIIMPRKKNPEEEAKKLLEETDWYVARQMETGEKIPTDVKKEREKAREILNNTKEK